MRHSPFIAMLLLVASAGARAEIVDIRWSADGRFSHSGTVAAGKFVEVCGTLPAGLKVRWDFKADTPVDFNVHYHVDKEMRFPFKLSAVTSARNTLHTKTRQDYCWMWSNQSAAPATLWVELRR